MPGYSATPLASKLNIKPDTRVCVLMGPARWLVGELPEGVDLRTSLSRSADTVVVFCRNSATLRSSLPRIGQVIFPNGAVWVAWPRKAAGHQSDISENDIRALALPTGLVDVKVAALAEDWSGLKLVWRKEMRDQPAKGTSN
jgi:hypothetical protein